MNLNRSVDPGRFGPIYVAVVSFNHKHIRLVFWYEDLNLSGSESLCPRKRGLTAELPASRGVELREALELASIQLG
jgi:hypothetical protein